MTSLNEFMHKNASPELRERYAAYPKEAAQYATQFDDLIVLDTETTGLQVYAAELIEIAAARVHKGKITDTFQTFVAPSRPIPPAITELTGITNADVAGAPQAEQAVRELATFVGGAPVLAHNAAFDRGFIEAVEGGKNVTPRWIDSLALSRIALPLLKNHKLQDMARAYGVCDVTHRALDDVRALAAMWPIMLSALASFGPAFLRYLAKLHPEVAWSYRDIFMRVADAAASARSAEKGAPFSLKAAREALSAQQKEGEHRRDDAAERAAELEPVTPEETEQLLGPQGELLAAFTQFEPRLQQQEMAERVAAALDSQTNLAIEVGTGVGKSLAYLAPLALYAKKNQVTCGVATKTNVLTDQIIEQELPRLVRAIPGGLSFAALKGYEHYPCFRKIELAAHRPLPDFETAYATAEQAKEEMLTALATTLAYATQFNLGDLDTLGIRWHMVPRALLSTTSKECQRSHCPYFKHGCMLHDARRQAASVDIVITNHALLLCDVQAEGKILPPIRQWVVDEAHGFAAEARRQWAHTAASDTFYHVTQQLGSREKGLLSRHIIQSSKLESPQPALGLLNKAASFLDEASEVASKFFESVHAAVLELAPKSNYDQAEVWVSDAVRETPAYAKLQVHGEELAQKLQHATQALAQYCEWVEDAQGASPADLAQPLTTLVSLQQALEAFFSHNRENRVFSISAAQTRKKRRSLPEEICVQELSVGPSLAERFYANTLSVVYCSGTLAAGSSFAHFDNAVGLDLLAPDEHQECQLSSPYDFDSHMSAIVVQHAPEPNQPAYLDALASMLVDVHVATQGSVLTLFTNRREMGAVYKRVKPQLQEYNLPLAQQSRKANMRKLAREFGENEHSSLFALRAFWEGFDASGDTLKCVVIPKLPFASPQDPLVQEREAHSKTAFKDYSLPEAILAVKQAAGRLIRTSTDIGIVVLADARVSTKGYGKQFVSALPTEHIEVAAPEDLAQAVRENLKRVERNR